MIHLITGKYGQIDTRSKTGCNKKFFDLPLKHAGQEYRNYENKPLITCPDCLKTVAKIQNMRGE